MNWIPIGLNWTILFKCLEMTIVVIWRYINKTELNWIEQTQAFRKMANEEQDEATSLYMCDELVMAQMRCTTAHSPSRSLFLSDGGDNNSNIVSFNFRLTIMGKKSRACAERSIRSTVVYMHVQWAIGSSNLGVLIWSPFDRHNAINPIRLPACNRTDGIKPIKTSTNTQRHVYKYTAPACSG